MLHSKSKINIMSLIARDGWTCSYCGRFLTPELVTVDHITPTLRGGLDTLANTVVSCRECNAQKGDMNFEEYIHWLAVRDYVFDEAPNEVIYLASVDLVVGKHQTHTRIALPALWAGLHWLDDEIKSRWEANGAIIIRMVRGRELLDVAFLSGVLFDYYAMKRNSL